MLTHLPGNREVRERPTFLFVTPLFPLGVPEVAAALKAAGRGGRGAQPHPDNNGRSWGGCCSLGPGLGSAGPSQCPGLKWERGSDLSFLRPPAGRKKGRLPTEALGPYLPMVSLCLLSRMHVPETRQACHWAPADSYGRGWPTSGCKAWH